MVGKLNLREVAFEVLEGEFPKTIEIRGGRWPSDGVSRVRGSNNRRFHSDVLGLGIVRKAVR